MYRTSKTQQQKTPTRLKNGQRIHAGSFSQVILQMAVIGVDCRGQKNHLMIRVLTE